MPQILIATVIPVALGVLGGAVMTFLVPWFRSIRDVRQRELLYRATKGAYVVIAAISRVTPGSLDDDLAKILNQVQLEMGRSLNDTETSKVKRIALALHADSSEPNLSPGSIAAALEDLGHEARKAAAEIARKATEAVKTGLLNKGKSDPKGGK